MIRRDNWAKLYIMIGLPGSGKSTYAKKLSKEINAKIVSIP